MKIKLYKTMQGLWNAFERVKAPTVASDDFHNKTIGFQEWPPDHPTGGTMYQIALSDVPAKDNRCECCGQMLPTETRPVPKGAPDDFWMLFQTAPGRQRLFSKPKDPR